MRPQPRTTFDTATAENLNPLIPLFEAIRLALNQLRVQKLKSFFTLLNITISMIFLIAVMSIIEGMSKYIEQDFAAKFLDMNIFNMRRFPNINTDMTEAE